MAAAVVAAGARRTAKHQRLHGGSAEGQRRLVMCTETRKTQDLPSEESEERHSKLRDRFTQV